jgi:hypothetical protein
MDPVNINHFTRGSTRESNYSLRGEPVRLTVKTLVQGGLLQFPVKEETTEEVNKQRVGLRGLRRQRAARAVVTRESIKVVPLDYPPPAPPEVVAVRLAGGSDADEKIAALEARIKVLLGIVERPKILAQRKAESIKKLEELFGKRRIR